MKVSGFTFLRNAESLGFPFIQSIQSVLPICDEFIVNLGKSDDRTLEMLLALNEPKIKIIHSVWNDKMRARGFMYGQQKMIAQYSCTGDWLFYLEADEVLHEQDLAAIKQAMQTHLNDDRVEALAFQYLHFYGNINTIAWSPAWYRRETRVIKSSVRSYAPDGLFWVVLDKNNKNGRYPRAIQLEVPIYHYGWVRSEQAMNTKLNQVKHFWGNDSIKKVDYSQIDSQALRLFEGVHPALVQNFFPAAEGLFQADPNHVLTKRERKNRWGAKLEKWLGWDLSKRHFSE